MLGNEISLSRYDDSRDGREREREGGEGCNGYAPAPKVLGIAIGS